MVSALKYLHAHKVIHRDLKLGNLFVDSKMDIKIGKSIVLTFFRGLWTCNKIRI